MDGQQAGHTDALDEQLAHPVSGGLGRDHHHVHVVGQHDFAIVDAEAVGHHEGAARLEVGGDLLPVDAALQVVRDHHHDHVRLCRHFGHFGNAQAGRFGGGDAGAAWVKADDHVLAVILQVQGVGVTLAAVADDADRLVGDVG